MGLIEKIFGKRKQQEGKPLTTMETFTAYAPVFTSWGGQLYESALVREAIYAKARHIMKLQFTMQGSAKRSLYSAVKVRPNPWSTWPDFLERCNNIYETQNNLIIVPVLDYAIPTKECCSDPGGCAEDPCALFDKVPFPAEAFTAAC